MKSDNQISSILPVCLLAIHCRRRGGGRVVDLSQRVKLARYGFDEQSIPLRQIDREESLTPTANCDSVPVARCGGDSISSSFRRQIRVFVVIFGDRNSMTIRTQSEPEY